MLKLSGEALKGNNDYGRDMDLIGKLCDKIAQIHQRGIQIAIVVGGGNIFRGAQGDMDRTMGDYIGMMATVMNGLVLGDALKSKGLDTKVLTSLEMPKVADNFVIKKAKEYMNRGKIIVCSGGVGSPYFTTDSAAVQKALELGCDVVVKATKVDGLYDKDPMKNPDAIKFDKITLQETYDKGLKVMDHSAIGMALENKLPLFICNIDQIDKIGTDEISGTYVGH